MTKEPRRKWYAPWRKPVPAAPNTPRRLGDMLAQMSKDAAADGKETAAPATTRDAVTELERLTRSLAPQDGDDPRVSGLAERAARAGRRALETPDIDPRVREQLEAALRQANQGLNELRIQLRNAKGSAARDLALAQLAAQEKIEGLEGTVQRQEEIIEVLRGMQAQRRSRRVVVGWLLALTALGVGAAVVHETQRPRTPEELKAQEDARERAAEQARQEKLLRDEAEARRAALEKTAQEQETAIRGAIAAFTKSGDGPEETGYVEAAHKAKLAQIFVVQADRFFKGKGHGGILASDEFPISEFKINQDGLSNRLINVEFKAWGQASVDYEIRPARLTCTLRLELDESGKPIALRQFSYKYEGERALGIVFGRSHTPVAADESQTYNDIFSPALRGKGIDGGDLIKAMTDVVKNREPAMLAEADKIIREAKKQNACRPTRVASNRACRAVPLQR